MSAPPEQLMSLMQGAGGASSQMPPTPPTDDAQTPPMAAPMTTPEPKMGTKEAALINVGIALDMLEQAVPMLGPDESEGIDVMQAIRRLTKALGGKRRKVGELQQSEILQLIQSLPQAGGATPEMKALASSPVPGMPPQGGQPQPPMM